MIIKLWTLCPLFLALVLIACGGGGAGTKYDVVAPVPTPTPNPAPTPTPTPVPTPTGIAPQIDIAFPGQSAYVESGSVRVRGIASDDIEVVAVWVNGVEAQMTRAINAPGALREGMAGVLGAGDTVAWQAQVELQVGETVLEVRVIDNEGLQSGAEPQIKLYNDQLPLNLVANNSDAMLVLDWADASFSMNLSTLQRETLGEMSFKGVPQVDNVADSILSYSMEEDVLAVHSLSLNQKISRQVAGLTLSYDPDIWNKVFINDAAIDNVNRVSYVGITITPNTSPSYQWQFDTEIYKTDLQSGTVSLLSAHTDEPDKNLYEAKLAVSDGRLFALDSFRDRIVEINLESGERTVLVDDLENNPWLLSAGGSDNALYTIGIDSNAKIDINMRSVSYFGYSSNDSDTPLRQPWSSVIDLANNRIWVSDASLDVVYTLDLDSGKRIVPIRTGRGEGVPLYTVGKIRLYEDTLYLVDKPGSSGAQLFAVERVAGNRSRVVSLPEEGWGKPASLDVDTGGVIYLGQGDAIFSYDPQTAEMQQLLGSGIGEGVLVGELSAFLLDEPNGRLLVADRQFKQIVEIDLQSLNRATLYTYEALGVEDVTDFSLEPNGLYLLSRVEGELSFFNVESGTRVSLLTSCKNSYGYDVLFPDNTSINRLVVREDGQEILLSGSVLIRYNVVSKDCDVVSSDVQGGAEYLSDEIIYIGGWNEVYSLDLVTGEKVVISKR